MEEIKSIRISELKDFKNHPFHVQQDIELCALMKSIEDEGVIVPLDDDQAIVAMVDSVRP